MAKKTANGRKRYDKFNYKVGSKSELIGFAAAVVLLCVSLIPLLAAFPKDLLCMISAVLCSYPAAIDAFYGLKKKKPTKALLVIVIIIASMIIGRFFDAALCAVLLRLSDMAVRAASHREAKQVEKLRRAIAPTGHLVREEGGFEIIDSSEITVGSALAVLPGETLPVDALIESGKGAFDYSPVTGDTTPVFAGPGDIVPAGAVNGQSTVFYIAYSDKESSAASRFCKAVERSCGKEFPDGKHIKLAKYISITFVAAGIALAVIGSIISRSPLDYIGRGIAVAALCLTDAVLAGIRLISRCSLTEIAASGAVLNSPSGVREMIRPRIILFCESVFSKRSPNVRSAVNLLKSYGAEKAEAVIADENKAAAEFASQCGIDRVYTGGAEITGSESRLILDDCGLSRTLENNAPGNFVVGFNTPAPGEGEDASLTGGNVMRLAAAVKKCMKSRGLMRLFTILFAVLKVSAAALAAAGITPIWVSFAADALILIFAFVFSHIKL